MLPTTNAWNYARDAAGSEGTQISLRNEIRKLVDARRLELEKEDQTDRHARDAALAKLKELTPFLEEFASAGVTYHIFEEQAYAQIFGEPGQFLTIHPPGGPNSPINAEQRHIDSFLPVADGIFDNIESMIEGITPWVVEVLAELEHEKTGEE